MSKTVVTSDVSELLGNNKIQCKGLIHSFDWYLTYTSDKFVVRIKSDQARAVSGADEALHT